MERVEVHPAKPLQGRIRVPPDKSITHRALLFAGIAKGRSRIRNPLTGEDCLRTLTALRHMGLSVAESDGSFVVDGKGLYGLSEPRDVIDCGNSGTTARMLCGLLCGQRFFSVLTGDESLRNRPMSRVTDPLRTMGARFMGREEATKLPLAVQGSPLSGIGYESPVASAQVKTALLLAGLYAREETVVSEPEKSRDHTERMLRAMGAPLREDGLTVAVHAVETLGPLDMTVPGDLSSAAFFIVAATLVPESKLIIENVGVNPTRSGILDLLSRMGASISFRNELEVSGEPVVEIVVEYAPLSGIEISADQVVRAIDEFPILCVAAALADGETCIRGAAELRVKESDRIAVMVSGLRAMGVEVEEFADGLCIQGAQRLRPGIFPSYGDHRVAMSMAVAGLRADSPSVIQGTECVATSFPGFWELLCQAQKGVS